MLEVGDMVKIISKCVYSDGEEYELIPVGTICEVIGVDILDEDGICYNIRPISGDTTDYWYSENEVEKGHLEWIKED